MTPPGPTLIEAMPEPSRTGVPECGSVTPTAVRLEMVTGADQMAPWLLELIARSSAELAAPVLSISVKMLTATPVGGARYQHGAGRAGLQDATREGERQSVDRAGGRDREPRVAGARVVAAVQRIAAGAA